jgi:hypothetical protein
MKIRDWAAIIGALVTLSLCPAARAQCGGNCECGSEVEYDVYSNEVWGYSWTQNYYYLDDVSVSAGFESPQSLYYAEDFYEWTWAEVDFGPVSDGDGDYYIFANHYDWGGGN